MTAVKQHRRLTVGSGELQPSRCRLVSRFDLRDNAGQRAITQGILRHGKHATVARSLRIKDPVRTKPYLFEARCIEVKLRDCPERCKVLFGGEAGRYARDEQRGCRIIIERRRCRRNLVQCRPIQPAIRKAFIERGDAER